jgi:AraC-like DNA-binding protein
MRAKTKIWQPANIDAAFLRGEFKDFSYEMHTHDTICLSLITRGAIRIKMRGSELTAHEGDLYTIKADIAHAGWSVDPRGWALQTVYVDETTIRGWAGQADPARSSLAFRSSIIRDPGLAVLFRQLHRVSEQCGSALEQEQLAIDLGSRLVNGHTSEIPAGKGGGGETPRICLAKEYLNAHFGQRVSLSDIATATGLSPYRLYRAFEREVGMTPHEFQRQVRVRFAAREIRAGQPLAAVAAAAGFADQAHFTKSFFRHLATTPGAYRRAVRNERAT